MAMFVAATITVALAGCHSGPSAGGSPDTGTTTTPTGSTSATPSPSGPSSSPSSTHRPSTHTPSPSTSPTKSPSPTRTATGCAAKLSLEEQVGQLFVMGVAATGATQAQLQLLQDTKAGSVIMMGNTDASVAGVKHDTDAMRAYAHKPPGVQLMVTVDQEGGQVRRLRGQGFDTMPSATTQASFSDATLRAKAKRWGAQLKQAGVDADLAPVADVVPTSIGRRNKPIGALDRGYGSDPLVVGRKVTAVIKGMDAGHEATTVKHFPGLGRVTGNTDFATKVVDPTTTRHDSLLGGFDAGIKAGADMVMVSTAYYAKIDANNPAAFSRTVITGMLRDDRRYRGVIISDDLGIAKAVSGWTPGERAIKFIDAGGDLITNVDPFTTDDMVRAVIAKAKQDPAFRSKVAKSANRVLSMKAGRGLSTCG